MSEAKDELLGEDLGDVASGRWARQRVGAEHGGAEPPKSVNVEMTRSLC